MVYDQIMHMRPHLIIGYKQTIRAMKQGETRRVFIADDADDAMVQKIITLAKELNISYYRVPSKQQLGKACGIEVAASTACIKR